MDPNDGQVVSVILSLATTHDEQMMESLLQGLSGVNNIYADGAYISQNCFEAIVQAGAKAKIPLRTGTSLAKVRDGPGLDSGLKERNRLVREIWEKGGVRHSWKKETDYHRRSLVENTMYRFKTIFGGNLSNRKFEKQEIETRIKVSILNRMAQLGMPDSYRVA